jgi:hypothetical protein
MQFFSDMDLPKLIRKENNWVSFQPLDDNVLRLRGVGLVGNTKDSGVMSLIDAKLELKYYLRDGWK